MRHLLFSSLLLAMLTLLQIYSGTFALYRYFPALVGVSHGMFAVVMFAVVFKLHFSFWRADPRPTLLSDMVDLAKPSLALLVMLTVAVGILAAPEAIDPVGAVAAFVFVFFAVAGGGILNCCMEKEVDGLMERTRGRVDATALCLFAILFWWQIPHFLAISVYRSEEYRRAGIVYICDGSDFESS